MTRFFLGLALGIIVAVPLAALLWRRSVRRGHRLAERARAAERLAELGTLTGGLAHEIKNPLSSVGMNIQLIQEDLDELARDAGSPGSPGSPGTPASSIAPDHLGRVQRRVDALARETQRLRDILEDFLRFAGRVKLDLTPTDLGQVVSELVDFFQPQAGAAGVRLRTHLPDQPVVAPADPSLLKQSLLNLLLNATQAITDARSRHSHTGGTSSGQAGNEEIIVRVLRVKAGDRPEAQIHVIDTGPGMAPDTLAKIFQPYFSTKKTGTGLGLPTTRRIIEEHGGTIRVHSEPGKGSDFVINLPLHPPTPVPAPA